MTDLGATLGAILGSIFPGAFIFGVMFFAFKMQKHFFKVLFERFQTEETMPKNSAKASTFQYGKGTKVQNSVKLSESQDGLFIKFPLNKNLKIPFTSIKSAELSTGPFKTKNIHIFFTDESIETVKITMKSNLLSKFPQLLKLTENLAAKTKPLSQNLAENLTANMKRNMNENAKANTINTGEETQNYNKDYAINMASIKHTINKKNPMLLSQIQNAIRAFLLIGLLIAGGIILVAYYS